MQRKRRPSHPGEILKNLYLVPLNLTVTKLSQILGVSRKTLSGIVNAKKSVTPEMALRLSRAFPNTTPESWLNLQKYYDIWLISKKIKAWRSVKPVSSFVSENKVKYKSKKS